jgi:hypothetical protein
MMNKSPALSRVRVLRGTFILKAVTMGLLDQIAGGIKSALLGDGNRRMA